MTISLSIIEIIVLMLGAIVLGITIHFFITSRKNLKTSMVDPKKKDQHMMNEWKLKYFNDIEIRDKELISLKSRLEELEESNHINSIEAEEQRKHNKKLQSELETAKKAAPTLPQSDRSNYFDQLLQAQASLVEHNERISQLLGNIDVIKETEEKQKEILKVNIELEGQVEDLRSMLSEKEQEIRSISQRMQVSNEMTSMLDNAYSEFSSLQEKIQKLESQVNSSKTINMEYEDLKEEHVKLRRDYDEQKHKLNATASEIKELREQLIDTEDNFKEANFQRQQLQKRVAYLEELNADLQAVSDANKRLEGQIKRIGELESMLNVMSEEREQLIRGK
jgi:chromosome segregation ATPase